MKGTRAVVSKRVQREFRRVFGKPAAVVAAVVLLWLGAAGVVSADMLIVEDVDGMRTETYVKNDRVLRVVPHAGSTIFHCTSREITLISPVSSKYWQGSLDQLEAEIEATVAALTEVFGGMPMLGDSEEALLDVQVKRVGTDTVAGYPADHYVVETGRGGTWEVYEEVWVSSELMAELRRETEDCADLAVEMETSNVTQQFGSGLNLTELESVLNSPEYVALFEAGYPVRTKTVISVFGMEEVLVSEVVEVNRDPVPDSLFVIPNGYTRGDSIFEIMMEGF